MSGEATWGTGFYLGLDECLECGQVGRLEKKRSFQMEKTYQEQNKIRLSVFFLFQVEM